MTTQRSHAPQDSRRRWRSGLRIAAKLALLALALGLTGRLLAGLEWEDLAARLEGAHRPWLAAALGALVLRFVLWEERWRRAIARVGPLPPRSISLPSLLAAATVNTITPTARVLGGVMRARHLSRAHGEPMGRAYGSVLYDQVAHQVVNGILTWVSLIAAAALTGRQEWALALTVALLVAAGVFTVWLRRRRSPTEGGQGGEGGGTEDRPGAGDRDGTADDGAAAGEASDPASNGGGVGPLVRWLADRVAGRGRPGRLQRLVAHGREAVGVVRRLLSDGRLTVEAFLLGVGFFVVNAAAQWLVFRALDAEVGFVVVLAVVSLGAGAGVAVGTPGGIGGAEAAMIAAFTAFGVPPLEAAAGSLLFRAFHFASILGLGAPSLLWLEARLGRRDAPPPGTPGAPAADRTSGDRPELPEEQ